MTYQLTSLDLQHANALFSTGNYAAMYNYIADSIEANNAATQVDNGVILWLRSAAQINSNDGSWMSEYVRNHTMNAAANKGTPITEADFQNASDLIAQGVYDLINNPLPIGNPPVAPPAGTIPTAAQIIQLEVNEVVVNVLGLEDDDWAGTMLAWKFFGYNAVDAYIDSTPEFLEQSMRVMLIGSGTSVMELTEFVISTQQRFAPIRQIRDPLVIDLDGDNNVSLTEENAVYFDMDNDNFAESISWVSSNDGLLVFDKNNNGRIDNASELFGDANTPGFTALAAYDSNGNGILNSQDFQWNKFKIWQDLNQDGLSQSHELSTLSSHGFLSIILPTNGENDSIIYTSTDTVLIRNVNFESDEVNTRYSGEYALDLETLFLPTLRGYTTLADLHIAMSLNSTLKTQAKNIAALTPSEVFDSFSQVRSDFTALMYRWAGVQNVSPTSRGVFLDDARKLAFLEKMLDENFFQARFPETNPLSLAAEQIMELFDDVRDDLLARFLIQLDLGRMFATTASFDISMDEIIFDTNSTPFLSQSVLSEFGAEGANATSPLSYWANIAWFIEQTRGSLENFSADELTWLNAAVALSDSALNWDLVKDGYESTTDQNLTGDGNPNVITGELGNDTLTGHAGDDTLDGAAGEDVLIGGDGNDIIIGNAGHDQLFGNAGNDTLRDGTGSDLIEGGLGNDTYIWGGGTNDFIFDEGGDHDVVQLGFSGSVTLERRWNDDLLIVSGSNTLTIQNQLNDPTLAHAIEEIRNSSGSLLMDLENYSGQIITRGGSIDDHITGVEFGGSFNDTVYAGNGNDEVIGGFGNDILFGEAGADFLDGGEGSDTLYGEDGDDTLKPGEGNDIVYGGTGHDTYLFSSGHDTFIEGGSGINTIIADTSFSAAQLSIFRQYMIGGVQADMTRTTILRFDEDNSIAANNANGFFKTIQFANGDAAIDLDKLDLTTYGSEGNDLIEATPWRNGNYLKDTIFGYGGDDVIWDDLDQSFFGDDYIDGGYGNDTIRIGYGNDVVYGGFGNDQIETYKHNLSGAHIHGGNLGLELHEDGSDTLSYNSKSASYPSNSQLQINIADPLNGWAQIFQLSSQQYFGARDIIISIENILGTQTNDHIIGNAANNYFFGNNGNDYLSSEGGDDILDGGSSSDILHGGDGNDVYVLRAYGLDTAYDTSGIDTIRIGGDHNSNLNYLTFSQVNSDLLITSTYSTPEDILQVTDFYAGHEIEYLETLSSAKLDLSTVSQWIFDTTAAETLSGTASADTIVAGRNNDLIYGLDGNDTIAVGRYVVGGSRYLYGGGGADILSSDMGNDYLFGEDGNDTLYAADSNYLYGGSGDDHFIALKVDQLRVEGGDGIDTFDAHLEATNVRILVADLQAGTYRSSSSNRIFTGIENLIATKNADIQVLGTSGSNMIDGQAGNDEIYGRGGDDFLVGGFGSDYLDGGDGNDTASYSYSNQKVEINLQLGFSDETEDGISDDILISIENLVGSALADTLTGDNNSNILTGMHGDDELSGGAGIDTLNGGDGIDTAIYATAASGMTANLHSQVSGNDGDGGSDTFVSIENIIGSAYNDTIYGSAGKNVIHGGAGNDDLRGYGGDDMVYGEDGNDLIYGVSTGNETIYGGNGDDTINSGRGNDAIYGGDGRDMIYTSADAGIDGGDGIDEVRFGATESYGVNVNLTTGELTNTNGNTGSIINIERVRGTAYADAITGTLENNILTGEGGDDTLYGMAGADLLMGYDGDDILYGGDDNDTSLWVNGIKQYDAGLYGGNGNDTLYGGVGNDRLEGDDGNDVLYGQAGIDYMQGGAGTDSASYALAASGVTLTLHGGSASNDGDGGTDTLAGIENVIGSAYADALTGSDLANVIRGGNGNDYIHARAGNDIIAGGSGDDTLYGGDGADNFRFESAGGIDTIFDFSLAQGDVLDISEIIDFDPLTDALTDFVSVTTSGSNTIIAVDQDGVGGYTTVAQLNGTSSTLNDLGDFNVGSNLLVA